MKNKLFGALLLAALIFDIWFSDGYPWTLITVVMGAILYIFTTPYLRI